MSIVINKNNLYNTIKLDLIPKNQVENVVVPNRTIGKSVIETANKEIKLINYNEDEMSNSQKENINSFMSYVQNSKLVNFANSTINGEYMYNMRIHTINHNYATIRDIHRYLSFGVVLTVNDELLLLLSKNENLYNGGNFSMISPFIEVGISRVRAYTNVNENPTIKGLTSSTTPTYFEWFDPLKNDGNAYENDKRYVGRRPILFTKHKFPLQSTTPLKSFPFHMSTFNREEDVTEAELQRDLIDEIIKETRSSAYYSSKMFPTMCLIYDTVDKIKVHNNTVINHSDSLGQYRRLNHNEIYCMFMIPYERVGQTVINQSSPGEEIVLTSIEYFTGLNIRFKGYDTEDITKEVDSITNNESGILRLNQNELFYTYQPQGFNLAEDVEQAILLKNKNGRKTMNITIGKALYYNDRGDLVYNGELGQFIKVGDVVTLPFIDNTEYVVTQAELNYSGSFEINLTLLEVV